MSDVRDRSADSDALLARLLSRMVPVIKDAGADGPARVFWVPSPDSPHPVIAAVARAWKDLA